MNAPADIRTDWANLTRAERLNLIKRYSDMGYSAGQIARQFSNCTRSAIVGYWDRHPECKGVPSAKAKGIARQPGQRAPRAPKPKVAKVPGEPRKVPVDQASVLEQPAPAAVEAAPPPPAPAVTGPVSILDHRIGFECAWVVDERSSEGLAMFCAVAVERVGGSWCREHAIRVLAKA